MTGRGAAGARGPGRPADAASGRGEARAWAGVDPAGWTFGRFIDELASRYADLEAIIASDQTRGPALRRWTYAELGADVQALQWALMQEGVEPGERVGVMLSSFPEWILYLFAVTRLGAVFVPINPRFRSRELHHVLRHSRAGTLVAMGQYLGHDYAAVIEGARQPGAAGGEAGLPALRRVLGVAGQPAPGARSTDELLAAGREVLAHRGPPPRADNADEVALLFYTSGTTSFPKAVPLTHANLLPHSVRAGELLALAPGERVLTLYPFFGISGGANKVLSTLGSGACLVFQDSYRPQEACELMLAQGCTVLHGVDVQFRELIRAHRALGAAPVERRATIAFTAGVDEALARDLAPGLGISRFIHAYGMTETNPMVLHNRLDDAFEVALRAGGRPAEGVEVRIVDPDTCQPRPPDVPGEIQVRGPTVMRGYLDDAEVNAASFVDGWFRTGDLGVATSDGWVFYVGRLKDMLKVGGFNVAPQEVESALRAHPDVADVAVTAGSDERLGEVPVAFVVPRPGARLEPAALLAWSRERIANFKVPRAVHVVDALPYHVAANGAKLQRHVLREWAQQRESESAP